MFVDRKNIDEFWVVIKEALGAGKLGDMAKVSTAMPNPFARANKHVICVYTYDAEDETDVRRVREALRVLGVVAKISYKTDDATRANKYAANSPRVSKYHE